MTGQDAGRRAREKFAHCFHGTCEHRSWEECGVWIATVIDAAVAEAVRGEREKHGIGGADFQRVVADDLVHAIAEARREEREACLRELWTRRCLPLCGHPECTRVKVIEEAIRRLPAGAPEGDPR